MREKRFACLVVIVFLSLLPYFSIQSCAWADELTPAQRRSLVCGPNATLLFLTMCGLNASEADIANLHSHDKGASLAEMHAFCEQQGLRTQILRFEIDDASRVRLPAIAHSDAGETDHYYVWYEVTEQFVLALDSTTGEKLSFRRERLGDFWTGYTIVPTRFARGQIWLSAAARRSLAQYTWLMVLLATILLAARYWQVNWMRDVVKWVGCRSLVHKKPVLPSLVLAASLTCSLSAAQEDCCAAHRLSAGTQWRDTEHGGQNCLFVFLRLITGRQLDYASLTDSNGQPPQSLVQLSRLAGRHTAQAALRQLRPADLEDLDLPALVHLHGDDVDEGCFVLLLQKQGQNFVFMNGPSATIGMMTHEDFIRRWSGYCLVRTSDSNRLWGSYVLGSISALMIVLSISFKGRATYE